MYILEIHENSDSKLRRFGKPIAYCISIRYALKRWYHERVSSTQCAGSEDPFYHFTRTAEYKRVYSELT